MKKLLVVLLIIPFLTTGCWNYNELNNLAVVTGFAIDYEDNKYKVSMLIANSKKNESSAKEGEATTTVYSGTGKNLSDAIKQIDRKSPKTTYIGHLSVVVISEKVGEKGILEISDLLLRNAESRKKFYFLQAKDCEAKDVLSLVIPLESFPSNGIANLLKTTSEEEAITTIMPYSYFIADILKPGKNPVLPSVEIIGDVDEGKSSSSLEDTNLKTYLKVSDLAIYSDDKFISYAGNDESQIINLLNGKTDSLLTSINDDFKVSFNISEIKSKTKLKNSNNIEIKVSGKADIQEVNDKIDLTDEKTIKSLEKKINKNITANINKTINNIKTKYKSDILGYGNMIYKKYPNVWKVKGDKWDEIYFKKLKINVSTNFEITSTGSLKQTIKEVK